MDHNNVAQLEQEDPSRPQINTVVDAASIPKALWDLPQFVCWKPVWDAKERKYKKIPMRADGKGNASSTDPDTWSTLDEAIATAIRKGWGIGFVVTLEDDITGIDLDHCIDPKTGELEPWALEFISDLDTYTERSPSGTGVRGFVYGKIPRAVLNDGKHGTNGGGIEVYEAERYFTVTGDHVEGTPTEVMERQAALDLVCAKNLKKRSGEGKTDYTADMDEADRDEVEAKAKTLYASNRRFKTLRNRKAKFKDQSASAYDLALATLLAELGWSDGEIITLLYLQREKHGDDTRKLGRADYLNSTIGLARKRAEKRAAKQAEYKMDDIGNGQRFAAQHGDIAVFIMEEKVWALFNRDGLLVRDKGGAVELLAEETARGIFQEAANARNADQAMAIAKHAARSAATSKLEAMLKRARTRCGISITELDADPLLVGVKNGVLDLRTGELLEGEAARAALVTRHCGASFASSANCPRWEAFLEKISGGDPAWVAYVQRVCGYLLTASTDERCFFILHGLGDNGKTVFLTVLQTLLAEYSEVMDMSFFMAEHGRGPAPSEMARLQDARFVTATEADHAAEWSPSLVKKVTGSDMLSGRPLYGNTVQFRPGFKIMVAVNHRPMLSQGDPALLRRVREIPFTVTLPKAEQVKGLSDALCGELSGILNWCVAGTQKWLSEGLAEPVCVQAATEANCEGLAIGDTDNQVEAWFAAECHPAPGAVLPFAELYEAYKKWSRRETECIRSTTWVGKRLQKLGVVYKRTRAGSFYHGIAITPPVEY